MQPLTLCRRAFLVFLFLFQCSALADYANINGIRMYYDVRGHGDPVVLLHGGYVDSDMWNIHSWLLSYHYQVIEIDSRGHGRSTDADVPITYEQMTDDTLALLDQLGVGKAHFVGWSDGAVIASQIAATQPTRVDRLVMIGAAYSSGAYVDFFTLVLSQDALFNPFVDSLFKPKYVAVNPDPGHWTTFRDKLHDLWLSPCYFDGVAPANCLDPLKGVKAETLVVVGEEEIIRASHTQAVVDRIPKASLKVVPYAGHFLPITRPFLTTDLIFGFLSR